MAVRMVFGKEVEMKKLSSSQKRMVEGLTLDPDPNTSGHYHAYEICRDAGALVDGSCKTVKRDDRRPEATARKSPRTLFGRFSRR